METKTKITFDKEEIALLLSAIDLYGFSERIGKFCSDDSIRVMNKFICKLRETDKMQLITKSEE